MKDAGFGIAFTLLILMSAVLPIRAKPTTKEEALTVAGNWITLIIDKKGNWGGSKQANVEYVQEFRRGERKIGYFCAVNPRGYILVSLLKGLAPVKAYSGVSIMNPHLDEGMTDFLKGRMERILNAIERQLGPIESVQSKNLEAILEVDYSKAWTGLNRNCADFEEELEAGLIMTDFDSSQVLITSNWHQRFPYYMQCPTPADEGSDCADAHCAVGCVATAGAQIMHFWNWPPYGQGGSPWDDEYEWINIPDTCVDTSTYAQKLATSELCAEVGEAVSMDYCSDSCSSSANRNPMTNAYEDNYRYSTDCDVEARNDYTPNEWFGMIKDQIGLNQPMQYWVPAHSIVCDGWQIVGSEKQYHMNYGWAGGRVDTTVYPDFSFITNTNTWYALDELPELDSGNEHMTMDIRPTPSIGGSFSGAYGLGTFPYRYVTRDATCPDSATFAADQNIQFLPHVEMKSSSSMGSYVKFEEGDTWLFSINNEDTKANVRMNDGAVKINPGGGIRFHGQYADSATSR